jgi:hypothetical protein
LAFTTAAAWSMGAYASTEDIQAVNNQVAIQAISTNVNYNEKSDKGVLLDSEGGHVPGFAISASVMKDLVFGNDYLQFQYSRANGNTDYVGSYISGGSYGSVVAKSGATLTDYSLRVGKGFSFGHQVMITPYAEIGRHEWKRGVNEGETYTNNFYGIGALAQSSVIKNLVLSANALIGRTVSSNIDVAGTSGFSGALGNSSLYKIGLSADYAFTTSFHANIGVDYRSFKYGRSANYVTSGGTFYEPKSESKYTTISAGVGYSY